MDHAKRDTFFGQENQEPPYEEPDKMITKRCPHCGLTIHIRLTECPDCRGVQNE